MSSDSYPFILMVEDNRGDSLLFEEALRERGSQVRLETARSVEEGIAILLRMAATGDYPCLILVDLHIPRQDGKAFLTFLAGDSRFSRLPTIMLSSSQRDLDREECLRLGADSFQIKPSDWASYLTLMDSLKPFWEAPAS